MMAWIKLRTDLADDPAVIAMSDTLKIDRFGIVGRLHNVWSWATDQLVDGNAPGVTGSYIDSRLSTPGFAASMAKVGWLVITDALLTFPKWEEHLSNGAKSRALTAKRVSDHRKKSNAPVTVGSLPSLILSTPDPAPLVSRGSGGVAMPPTLAASPEFVAAWVAYEKHRRELGERPLGPSAVEAQWARLLRWGLPRALEALRLTVAQGWKNIREPDNEQRNGTGQGNRQGGAGKDNGLARHIANQADRDSRMCGPKPKFPGE
jgi:hypothetical protein